MGSPLLAVAGPLGSAGLHARPQARSVEGFAGNGLESRGGLLDGDEAASHSKPATPKM